MNTFHKIDGCNWVCTGSDKCEFCRQGDVPTLGRDKAAERLETLVQEALRSEPAAATPTFRPRSKHVRPIVIGGTGEVPHPEMTTEVLDEAIERAVAAVHGVQKANSEDIPPKPDSIGKASTILGHAKSGIPSPRQQLDTRTFADFEGLSFRDRAALHAMQGFVMRAFVGGVDCEPKIASLAYKMADAMLAAREGGAS